MRQVVALLVFAAVVMAGDPMAGYKMKSKFIHASLQRARMEVEAEKKLMEGKPNMPEIQARDLRSEPLRPVENQGGCGSCVAFGTTHAIQDMWRYCTGTVPRLATQHILDCKLSCKSGGKITAAYDMFDWPGITEESCKRYRAVDGWCSHYGGFIFGWGKYHRTNCDTGARANRFFRAWGSTCTANHNTMVNWLDHGKPFTIGMKLMSKFYDHRDRVVARDSIYPRATGGTNIIGGHAMEVVGYGTLNNVPYWLIKNSWSSNWGDGGFVKVRRNPYNGAYAWIGLWEYFHTACRPLYYGCTGMKGLDTTPISKTEGYQPEDRSKWHLLAADDDTAGSTGELQTNTTGRPDFQPGGTGGAGKTDPLVLEAAYFSAHVLLAGASADGGFQCLDPLEIHEDENSSIAGVSIRDVEVMSVVNAGNTEMTIHSADQRVTGGVTVHLWFTFTSKDSRCTSKAAAGTYDATVYVSRDGYLIMQSIFPTDKPEEGADNTAAIIGGSVAAAVVVAGIIGFLAFRHYRTRKQYQKLEATHKEVVHRVTVLENGANGAVFREAALSKLLQEGVAPGSNTNTGPAVTLHMKSDTSSGTSV